MAFHPERGRQFPVKAPIEFGPIGPVPEENDDWYRDLVEHSRDLLSVHDLEGRILSVNPVPARLLGYTVEEMLQKPLREFIDPRFLAEHDAYLREIESAGAAHGLVAVMTRSGEQRIWEYHNSLRKYGVEKPIVRGIAHDVTERVRVEKALRASHEELLKAAQEREKVLQELKLFRTLLDQSNDAIQVIEPGTLRLLDVNETTCLQLGYSREELLAMTIYEIAPEFDQSARAEVLRQLEESDSAIIERVHRRKDGTTFPVEVNLRRVRLDREYGVAITRDITARKRYEEVLRASHEELLKTAQEREKVLHELKLFRTLLDQSNDAVEVVDPGSMRFLDVNERSCIELGYTREELLAMTVYDIDPSVNKSMEPGVLHQLRTSGSLMMESVHRRKDGTTFPVEVNIRRVLLEREYLLAVARNITVRKRVEEALQESAARERVWAKELETVLEAVPVAVCIAHDPECRRMTGNRAASEHLRVPKGRNFSMSAPPEERPSLRLLRDGVEIPTDLLPIQQAAATGKPVHGLPVTTVFEDGSEREVLVNAVPLLDESGKPWGAVGAAIDLTELKLAEKALRESELRFRTVYERSPMGIALVDSNTGQIQQANPKYCEITGRKETELLGLDVRSITHPDDVSQTSEYLKQLAEEKASSYETEKRYVRPDGSLRWVSILVVPMWSKGESRRVQMGLVRDITKRKQVEEALHQSEERFRVALKNSPIAVFSQDRDLRYTWGYNPQFPWAVSDKMGRSTGEVFDAQEDARVTEMRRRVLETGKGVRDEVQLTVGGKRLYLDTSIEPLLDTQGKIIGLTGASMNVTELREATEALREAKKKLAEEKLYLEREIDTELGFGEIIGQSKALQAVMEQVGKVAASDATVLLLGETGTGKELVARAVHRLSQRAGSSFIKMNCAAIPSGLLESELFGNEKGAFTGAVSKKIGRLELADKGTLFLDEIGEISLPLQPKLLRVLQDHEFERLGGTQTLKVDFRLIAATNRDLADSVRENEFRSDLYYRLNVFPIRVPPLRERREDIRLLVEHFVQKFARRMNKSITSIPRKTMDGLMDWDWPGNVRELENLVERSVILTQGTVLVAPLAELRPLTAGDDKIADETLEAAEREHILRALRESRGRIGGLRGAATRLGLKRTTLQSKLKSLGIDPRPWSKKN